MDDDFLTTWIASTPEEDKEWGCAPNLLWMLLLAFVLAFFWRLIQ